MATLEEEFESIEAHRDVRKAHVRAAEVAVEAAKSQFELISKSGNVPQVELMKARLEVDAARAQLEIRMAELKEVEVKVKYARKRLDDAKAAGVRPAPGARPVPIDPPPPAINELPVVDVGLDVTLGRADDKVVAELKRKIEELTATLKKDKEAVAKADAESKLAAEELAKILDIAMKGRVRAGTIEAAEAKAKDAKIAFEKAKERLKETENTLEKVKAKLKELEK
jgi:DNA repair exonuclease SbcCD ATPase subunit